MTGNGKTRTSPREHQRKGLRKEREMEEKKKSTWNLVDVIIFAVAFFIANAITRQIGLGHEFAAYLCEGGITFVLICLFYGAKYFFHDRKR